MNYEKLAIEVETTDRELAAFYRQMAFGQTHDEKTTIYQRDRAQLLLEFYLARRRKGLSQSEIAKQLNMTQSNYARLESSKSNPTLHTLLKIAEKLDVTITLQPKR